MFPVKLSCVNLKRHPAFYCNVPAGYPSPPVFCVFSGRKREVLFFAVSLR